MYFENILFSKSDGVAELTLNRPESFNVFSEAMAAELIDVLARCHGDEGVRSVIITGQGPAFSAGGDVKAMVKELDGDISTYFRKLVGALNVLISSLQRLPKPVIGAVNGAAAGAGVGLALACDLILASEKSRFTPAYCGIGLSPDGAFTYYLPRLIGTKRAMELMLTNRALDAKTALELGIINRIVPEDDLMREARELARVLAQGPTQAFGRSKVLLNLSGDEPLETQLELERQSLAEVSKSEDFREGVMAFVEKRKPVFKGR